MSMQREEYWQHGRKHRDGGPAVTIPGWREEWYQHGRVHREDGPALCVDRPCSHCIPKYERFGCDESDHWKGFSHVSGAPRSFFMYLETVLDSRMPTYGDFGAQPAVILEEMGITFPGRGPKWRVSDEWPCAREDLLRRISLDPTQDPPETEDAPVAINPVAIDQLDETPAGDGPIPGDSAARISIMDLLGSYSPTDNTITLYSGPIFETALALNRQLGRPDCCGNTLATIVFLHELGHAVDFTARIGKSSPSATHRRRQAKRHAIPEALAQYFTWTAMNLYGTRAREVFLALDSCQPPVYRQWRWLGDGGVASCTEKFMKARR